MEINHSIDLQELLDEAFNLFDINRDGSVEFGVMHPFLKDINKAAAIDIDFQDLYTTSNPENKKIIQREDFITFYCNKALEFPSFPNILIPFLQREIKHFGQPQKIEEVEEEQQEEEKEPQHYARIKFGEEGFHPKTTCRLRLLVGEQADREFENLSSGITMNQKGGLLISAKVKNPARAEESIKFLIPRLLGWFNDFLPSKSKLDFKQAKVVTRIGDESLKIWLEPDNKDLNEFIEEVEKAKSRIILDGLEGNADLEIKLKNDFDTILKEELDPLNQTFPKRNLFHYLFEGASLVLKGSLTESVLDSLRNGYFKSKDFKKLPDGMRDMAFLLLWKSTKIELNFKKFRASFLENVLGGKFDLSIAKLLNKVKEWLVPLQKKHAILKTLFIVLQGEFQADIKFSLKVPGALAHLELNTKGIKEVYDYSLTQN